METKYWVCITCGSLTSMVRGLCTYCSAPLPNFLHSPEPGQVNRGIHLGYLSNGNEFRIPLDYFGFHFAFYGVTGSGKTKRGWETFITDELVERLRNQSNYNNSERLWESTDRTVMERLFRLLADRYPELAIISKQSKRSKFGNRHKYHLYSLKKFFFSQATAEVGDAVARAWCGQKAYLANYLRLPLEDRQKLYLRLMPRLTVFASEPQKTTDILQQRLKARGLTDEKIAEVLEGLVL